MGDVDGARITCLNRGEVSLLKHSLTETMCFFETNDTNQNHAMTIDPATQEEINRLYRAVDDFAVEMKARLREQAIEGYRGWDDPANYQRIVEMMIKHAAVSKGEEVDAANLAMILWNLRRRTDVD